MSAIYSAWRFTENPFTIMPLQPNATGAKLLVGRDSELDVVVRRLCSPPKCVTVEGVNGIGKTSLINVAVHRAYTRFLNGLQQDLLLPCSRVFQLDATGAIGADDFVDTVYLEIAQTILRHTEVLKSGKSLPQSHAINSWLNSPQVHSWQVGVQMVAGANAGRTTETNTSSGFTQSGFRKHVDQWLSAVFPNGQGGGVVCIIDNLELLETSSKARQLLERIRDPLLTVPGIRWVLCGSTGIVGSVVSTPRLVGILHKPIEISGIEDRYSADVLTARIETFSDSGKTPPYLPLTSQDFAEIYHTLHGNLRSTLGACDDYCTRIADLKGHLPSTEAEKTALFNEWLEDESVEAYNSAQTVVNKRAWAVLEKAVAKGGIFSPSEFEDFGFKSQQGMTVPVNELESAGLITKVSDETDRRRKTIQITPRGWLVARACGALMPRPGPGR